MVIPAPGSAFDTKKKKKTMSDENLFWREMEARLDEEEDEEALHLAMDALFQEPPPQRGGGGSASAAVVDDEAVRAGPSRGCFHFRLDPVLDRSSQRLGVHERVLHAHVEQQVMFERHDQLAARFVEGLRTAMGRVLKDDRIADRDRVYFFWPRIVFATLMMDGD